MLNFLRFRQDLNLFLKKDQKNVWKQRFSRYKLFLILNFGVIFMACGSIEESKTREDFVPFTESMIDAQKIAYLIFQCFLAVSNQQLPASEALLRSMIDASHWEKLTEFEEEEFIQKKIWSPTQENCKLLLKYINEHPFCQIETEEKYFVILKEIPATWKASDFPPNVTRQKLLVIGNHLGRYRMIQQTVVSSKAVRLLYQIIKGDSLEERIQQITKAVSSLF